MFQNNNIFCQDCIAYRDSLFRNVPQKDLEQVEACKTTGQYSKGELLFQNGDPAENFYCIMKGSVQIYRSSPNREQSFAIVGPGTWVGYRDALAGQHHQHNARALTPVTACQVNRSVLKDFIDRYPSFTAAILKEMAEGWVESERQSYNLGARKTVERLADFLLGLTADYHPARNRPDMASGEEFVDQPLPPIAGSVADHGIQSKRVSAPTKSESGPHRSNSKKMEETEMDYIEVEFPLTRETVATLIGTTTESVIRTLSDFRARGWIEFGDGKIRIKNEKELSKLVRES